MSEKKRKIWYGVFKVSGFLTSCLFPLYAIYEHFPIWVENSGSSHSLGSGVIIAAIVLLIIFKSTVFSYLKEKLGGKHFPPITIWIVLLVVVYVLIYINKFLIDLTTILWMGLVGCLIGTILTYIADHKFAKKDEEVTNGRI